MILKVSFNPRNRLVGLLVLCQNGNLGYGMHPYGLNKGFIETMSYRFVSRTTVLSSNRHMYCSVSVFMFSCNIYQGCIEFSLLCILHT